MTVTTQIQAHHLPPLTDPNRGKTRGILRAPSGAICATNGQAILSVRGLKVRARPAKYLARVEEMRWAYAGDTQLELLRDFVRRKQSRVRRENCLLVEPVSVFGVHVDAMLLRRYLPGGFGPVRARTCVSMDSDSWRRAIGSPALRISKGTWELTIMAIAVPVTESFP